MGDSSYSRGIDLSCADSSGTLPVTSDFTVAGGLAAVTTNLPFLSDEDCKPLKEDADKSVVSLQFYNLPGSHSSKGKRKESLEPSDGSGVEKEETFMDDWDDIVK